MAHDRTCCARVHVVPRSNSALEHPACRARIAPGRRRRQRAPTRRVVHLRAQPPRCGPLRTRQRPVGSDSTAVRVLLEVQPAGWSALVQDRTMVPRSRHRAALAASQAARGAIC